MDTHVTDINMLPNWAASKASEITARAGALMESPDSQAATRALEVHGEHSAAYNRLTTAHENYRSRAREMENELKRPEGVNLDTVLMRCDRLGEASIRLKNAEIDMGQAFDAADAVLCAFEAGEVA